MVREAPIATNGMDHSQNSYSDRDGQKANGEEENGQGKDDLQIRGFTPGKGSGGPGEAQHTHLPPQFTL